MDDKQIYRDDKQTYRDDVAGNDRDPFGSRDAPMRSEPLIHDPSARTRLSPLLLAIAIAAAIAVVAMFLVGTPSDRSGPVKPPESIEQPAQPGTR